MSGAARAPSYLAWTEAGAELKPATGLAGKTTRETVEAISGREGAEADVIAIGPAGERRVRFACLTHYWKNREGWPDGAASPRCSGAKNLKAVMVKGARKTEIAEPGQAQGAPRGDARAH